MKNNMLESIANKIVCELKEANVESYIWHVANTGSVYIRFKDPRMCSIRIGDHNGRDKLKYKYNLRNDLRLKKGKWVKDNNIWRYYSPLEKWRELIPMLVDRKKKLENWEGKKYDYGIPRYKQKETPGK